MKKLVLLLTVLTVWTFDMAAFGQDSFDLVAIDTKKFLGNFSIVPGSARLITDRAGYDNQPHFINKNQLAFSSQDEKGMHDIILYNFESGNFTNMTRTQERSEFSPRITDCGQYISAVTVESDSSQRLWLYPVNMGEPEILYDDIEPVAYYAWYNNIAAMMVLGDPNRLVYPYSRDSVAVVGENVGRNIEKRPKTSQITYLDMGGNVVINGKSTYEIKSYDLENNEETDFGVAISGSEDFIWIDKHKLLMASGQDLYIKNTKKSRDWVKIASVSLPNYGKISRMTLSPKADKLVLVMERKDN